MFHSHFIWNIRFNSKILNHIRLGPNQRWHYQIVIFAKFVKKFAVSAISQVCWKAAGCRMRNGVCAHKSDNAPKVTFEISSWSLRSINWSLWSLWSSMDISHQSDIVLKVSSWSSLAINRPRSFLYILS